jgi:uncharacterized repeat protein (TIGR03806 family)
MNLFLIPSGEGLSAIMSVVKPILLLGSVAIAALLIMLPISQSSPTRALLSGPTHRYSFTAAPTNNASGLLVEDSIGKAHGVVRGAGSQFTGHQLILPGGNPDIAAYIALPKGLLSSNSTNYGGTGQFSIEGWIRITGEQPWCRFFDFGSSGVKGGPGLEIIGPGGTQEGLDYLMYSAEINRDENARRLELRDDDPPGGGTRTVDTFVRSSLGEVHHFVVTWNEKIGEIRAYENGKQVCFVFVTAAMSNINDINSWIGRSQWHDNNLQGEVYEVRIYDHVLSPAEVEFNQRCGPDKLVVAPPVAADDCITLNRGGMALIPVIRNNRGTGIDPHSVEIVTQPSFGAVRVDLNGSVLYSHNGGPSSADQFLYTLKDRFGNTSAPATVRINFSNSVRLPNVTLSITNKPPAAAYEAVNAFPGLDFENPLALRSPPNDSNLLCIVERRGIVSYIPDVTAAIPERRIFLNIAEQVAFDPGPLGELGLQSMAFHPGFASNGIFFVFYTAMGSPYFDRLSRFTRTSPTKGAGEVDPSTEQILLNISDREFNHNAGDLHFGPDGYLYVSLGDEGGQMNFYENAQRIDKDFFSGIIRIDVDRRPGSLEPHYNPAVVTNRDGLAFFAVPPDNPFVNVTNFNNVFVDPSHVREEFWAVGLRNPWRMSFDESTGDLWVGDTGQDTYEEVNLIVKGGNYGWAFREGSETTPGTPTEHIARPPPGFVAIDPVWQYPHTSQAFDPAFTGNAVIGGGVYRGDKLPELFGRYIFGDFVSGNIWALSRQNGTVQVKRLASQAGIAAYGADPSNGDILLANYVRNKVERLARSGPNTGTFPLLLSQTGIFADLVTLTPNPGILEYVPNVAFWSDYAFKRRWFSVPHGKTISFDVNNNWSFPAGMVWIKHFEIEMTRGAPKTRRRLETRVLVKTDEGIFGVSYKWNSEQTDATLVEEPGEIVPLEIRAEGGRFSQAWEIPSRASCSACHTRAGGYALSFNTRQLNRNGPIDGTDSNQIKTLHEAGYFDSFDRSLSIQSLPSFAALSDLSKSLTERVRSYLAVNCSQCHQPSGTAPATWDARPTLPLSGMGLINGLPKNFGNDPRNRLVIPGDPGHSVLLMRLNGSNNFSRMPPLASHMLDVAGADLVESWIRSQASQSTQN